MSRESYVRGFCKAAAAAGVDPEALAKYAQEGPGGVGPFRKNLAQSLIESGSIKKDTPFLQRMKERIVANLPWGAHWQYKPWDPGYIAPTSDAEGIRYVAVPSRLRTAQVLGQNTGEMNIDDWRIAYDVKAHRPISAADHSQMQNAIERSNPDAAKRTEYHTVGRKPDYVSDPDMGSGAMAEERTRNPNYKPDGKVSKKHPTVAKKAPAIKKMPKLNWLRALSRIVK